MYINITDVQCALSTKRRLFSEPHPGYNRGEVRIMDTKRRKELLEEYKHRRRDMGVISLRCKTTGESFLGTSTDVNADFNSNRAKLNMNSHPNKRLLTLWKEHGADDFEFTVRKSLECKDPTEDYTDKLEELREQCLEEDPQASKIWK